MSPISKTKTPIAFLTLTKSNPDRLLPKTTPDRNFKSNQIKARSPTLKNNPPIAFPTLTKSNRDRPFPKPPIAFSTLTKSNRDCLSKKIKPRSQFQPSTSQNAIATQHPQKLIAYFLKSNSDH